MMNYEEFRRHLGKAGLTVNEFASLLDVQPSTVSNYSKKRIVPRAYAALSILLGDAGDNKVDFRSTLTRFGIIITSSDRRKVAQISEYRATTVGRPKRGST